MFALGRHKQNIGHQRFVLSGSESPLQKTDLVDELDEGHLYSRLVNIVEDPADDCKEQVEKHHYIEDQAAEEIG